MTEDREVTYGNKGRNLTILRVRRVVTIAVDILTSIKLVFATRSRDSSKLVIDEEETTRLKSHGILPLVLDQESTDSINTLMMIFVRIKRREIQSIQKKRLFAESWRLLAEDEKDSNKLTSPKRILNIERIAVEKLAKGDDDDCDDDEESSSLLSKENQTIPEPAKIRIETTRDSNGANS